jgi:hypothetical protein
MSVGVVPFGPLHVLACTGDTAPSDPRDHATDCQAVVDNAARATSSAAAAAQPGCVLWEIGRCISNGDPRYSVMVTHHTAHTQCPPSHAIQCPVPILSAWHT